MKSDDLERSKRAFSRAIKEGWQPGIPRMTKEDHYKVAENLNEKAEYYIYYVNKVGIHDIPGVSGPMTREEVKERLPTMMAYTKKLLGAEYVDKIRVLTESFVFSSKMIKDFIKNE